MVNHKRLALRHGQNLTAALNKSVVGIVQMMA